MRITLVQLDSHWENKPANFQKIRALLHHTPPAPGGIIVLPEMFSTGFSLDLTKTLHTHPDAEAEFCAELARQHQCCVIGGALEKNGPAASNLAIAHAPNGPLATYRKQRPFTGAGEHEQHLPGHTTTTFQWGGLTIAPLVCYDLRFPELFRAALPQGATAYIVIAAWPARRIQHWQTLLRARAIENQAYVIGVNRTGHEPRFTYNGHSLIIDPHGETILHAGEAECVAAAEIDPTLPQTWRNEFPAVRDYLANC